jgi:hypothetical protein
MTGRATRACKAESDAELYARYRKTAPVEDAKFLLRATTLHTKAMRAELEDLIANPPRRSEFYRRYVLVQEAWRELANRRERRGRRRRRSPMNCQLLTRRERPMAKKAKHKHKHPHKAKDTHTAKATAPVKAATKARKDVDWVAAGRKAWETRRARAAALLEATKPATV